MQAAVDATGRRRRRRWRTERKRHQTKATWDFKAVELAGRLDVHVRTIIRVATPKVRVNGTALVKTNFMGMMGFTYLPSARSLGEVGQAPAARRAGADTTDRCQRRQDGRTPDVTKNLLDQLKAPPPPTATSMFRSFPSSSTSMLAPTITTRIGFTGVRRQDQIHKIQIRLTIRPGTQKMAPAKINLATPFRPRPETAVCRKAPVRAGNNSKAAAIRRRNLDAGDMDAYRSRHLEWLRDGPRQSGFPEQSGRKKRPGHDEKLRHQCSERPTIPRCRRCTRPTSMAPVRRR